MKELIYKVIQNNKKNLDINDNTTFAELGIDSIEFIEIIIALEEEFNIRFEDMQLVYDNYQTVGQMVCTVQQIIKKTQGE